MLTSPLRCGLTSLTCIGQSIAETCLELWWLIFYKIFVGDSTDLTELVETLISARYYNAGISQQYQEIDFMEYILSSTTKLLFIA